ncbi:MAG: hypothetical protein NVS3B14_03720 [Ktedonobacteraceae bacterium]
MRGDKSHDEQGGGFRDAEAARGYCVAQAEMRQVKAKAKDAYANKLSLNGWLIL